MMPKYPLAREDVTNRMLNGLNVSKAEEADDFYEGRK
jgi:hypothetical protein